MRATIKALRIIFRLCVSLLIVAVLAAVGWLIYERLKAMAEEPQEERRRGRPAAPVAVAEVTRGSLNLRRRFSGTLEPTAEFMVSPKIGGRLLELSVGLSDMVKRGQRVGELDRDEYVLEVAQAKAAVTVAEANVREASNALTIADRELQRAQTMVERGVSSEAQLDTVQASHLARQAAIEVANGQLTRAQAQLQSAEVRLGYTSIEATWSGGNDERIVAARYVDEGQTVSANERLLSIVELNPILGVLYVTERDYGRLRPGLQVSLMTDAYPGETFDGEIARIAPIFETATRQARVELRVANQDLRLKPGLFIRASILLDSVDNATIVPEEAVTTYGGETGIFVVNEAGNAVRWLPVTTGIQEGRQIQIVSPRVEGRVVTLGHQLLDDGSPIIIAETMTTVQPPAAAAHDDGQE